MPALRVADQRPPAESASIPERQVAELRDHAGRSTVMGQEQEGQVIADRPRVARVCVVDAGPAAVDDQAPTDGRAGARSRRAASATARRPEPAR